MDDAADVKMNLAGAKGGSKMFTNAQMRQYSKFRKEAIAIEARAAPVRFKLRPAAGSLQGGVRGRRRRSGR